MSVIICILVFRGDAEGPRDVAESGGTNLEKLGMKRTSATLYSLLSACIFFFGKYVVWFGMVLSSTVHGLFCVLWVCLVHALVDKTRRNQQVGTLMVLVFF